MSMYRADIYQKNYADDTHYRYQHFWGAKKDKLMVFATALNLTNTKERCHRSLPLDEEDYYLYISPYAEEWWANGYMSGFQQVYSFDRRALTCKVMR